MRDNDLGAARRRLRRAIRAVDRGPCSPAVLLEVWEAAKEVEPNLRTLEADLLPENRSALLSWLSQKRERRSPAESVLRGNGPDVVQQIKQALSSAYR